MAILFKNNASTKLASGITAAATTMSVVAGTGDLFPSPTAADYFLCTLVDDLGNKEIVKVTARNVDTFTIVRAQEGTAARAFNANSLVENRLTAGALNEVLNVTYASAAEVAAGTATNKAISPATVSSAKVASATTLRTPRTLTIGNTGKGFDGSADVAWSLDEIGAARVGILADGTNLDTVVSSGFYRLGSPHGNAPVGVDWGQLIVAHGGGDTIFQIVTGFINGEIYWRQGCQLGAGGTGLWSAWHRFLHSGNLGAASETAAGIVELATTAEAQALASATLALTPARMDDAFKGANQSLSTSGYQRLPGGLILQWVRGTNVDVGQPTVQTLNWPVAFPTGPVMAFASYETTDTNYSCFIHSMDKTIVKWGAREWNGYAYTGTPTVFGIGW